MRSCNFPGEASWEDLVEFSLCEFGRLTNDALWTMYLEYVIGQKGPFSGYRASGEIQLLVQDAQRLYHRGVPKHGDTFQPAYGTAREDYGDFLTKISCRVFPTPLPNRYFSIERTCWVLDAMISYVPNPNELRYAHTILTTSENTTHPTTI